MLQRSKSLPHVMEFAQSGVELLRFEGICRFLWSIALVAATEVHDEQKADDAKSNERDNDHGRLGGKVSRKAVDRRSLRLQRNVHDGEHLGFEVYDSRPCSPHPACCTHHEEYSA